MALEPAAVEMDAVVLPAPRKALHPRLRVILIALLPIAAALLVSGLILLAVGIDPVEYYVLVVRRGLLNPRGLQETITRMAPLMLLGAALIVSFRAGLWNLGVDGQFILGAVMSAAAGPVLIEVMPVWLATIICMMIGIVTAALWSLLPAVLRAVQGVNEIITTLMMNFLGISLSNVLIKLVFIDPTTTIPVTRTLPVPDRLPRLFGTTVSIGVVIGIVVLLAVHLAMTHTAWGLRLRVLGANPRAARHAGMPVVRMTITTIALSAGLAGLAGAVVVLGTLGNVRAEWAPAYGLTIIPLVFLARMNGWAVIGFVFLFAMLSIGAESASIRLGVPHYYNYLLVGLMLIFLALVEYLDLRRRQRTV
jgi:simple sugar transport system permease protein